MTCCRIFLSIRKIGVVTISFCISPSFRVIVFCISCFAASFKLSGFPWILAYVSIFFALLITLRSGLFSPFVWLSYLVSLIFFLRLLALIHNSLYPPLYLFWFSLYTSAQFTPKFYGFFIAALKTMLLHKFIIVY